MEQIHRVADILTWPAKEGKRKKQFFQCITKRPTLLSLSLSLAPRRHVIIIVNLGPKL